MLQEKEVKKIGVLRALQLGDLMCAIPAVRALKENFPRAAIYLIGLPNSENLVRRFSKYFFGLIPFPGWPGLPEQPYNLESIPVFLQSMQEMKFDLILQMQGNGTIVNPLVALFGATHLAGFCTENRYRPPSGYFMQYPEHGHESRRHLLLMEYLGLKNTRDSSLEFPLTQDDHDAFEKLNLNLENKQYVCIHPGSRGSWRQWLTKYFATLADYCNAHGKKAVLTGTQEELPIVEAVVQQMKTRPFIAAGKTSLGAMALLIKNAFAILSNCTGVSHIASALNTPGIIISMDGEPERWAPQQKDILYTHDWLLDPDFLKVKEIFQNLIKNGKQPLTSYVKECTGSCFPGNN